jgi:hypothetical protein
LLEKIKIDQFPLFDPLKKKIGTKKDKNIFLLVAKKIIKIRVKKNSKKLTKFHH